MPRIIGSFLCRISNVLVQLIKRIKCLFLKDNFCLVSCTTGGQELILQEGEVPSCFPAEFPVFLAVVLQLQTRLLGAVWQHTFCSVPV